MKRKYEPKPYSSQGSLDSDTELVSWISDGMQKLSKPMQMEEFKGVMQYKETFYTYFQRKHGACSYGSQRHPPPITTTPIRLSQILLRLRPKFPVEERVWFRDYRTY